MTYDVNTNVYKNIANTVDTVSEQKKEYNKKWFSSLSYMPGYKVTVENNEIANVEATKYSPLARIIEKICAIFGKTKTSSNNETLAMTALLASHVDLTERNIKLENQITAFEQNNSTMATSHEELKQKKTALTGNVKRLEINVSNLKKKENTLKQKLKMVKDQTKKKIGQLNNNKESNSAHIQSLITTVEKLNSVLSELNKRPLVKADKNVSKSANKVKKDLRNAVDGVGNLANYFLAEGTKDERKLAVKVGKSILKFAKNLLLYETNPTELNGDDFE